MNVTKWAWFVLAALTLLIGVARLIDHREPLIWFVAAAAQLNCGVKEATIDSLRRRIRRQSLLTGSRWER